MKMDMTLDSGTSTRTSGSGMLISMASGRRKTVVTMKKISSRNATSTIGVMSMRTPTRFCLARPSGPLPGAPLSGSAVATSDITGSSGEVVSAARCAS